MSAILTRFTPFILFTILSFASSLPTLRAAITYTTTPGSIDPADPNTWGPSTYAYVGKTSDGSITVDGGSDLSSQYGRIGYNSGVTGCVTVDGFGSTWANEAGLAVGVYGIGFLYIRDKAIVSNNYPSYIGRYSDAIGTVTVDGAGSTWTNGSDLYIGHDGNGTLDIANGGIVSNRESFIGLSTESIGEVRVNGTDSYWTSSDRLYIGSSGTGTMTVTNGGTVSNEIYGYIGYSSGSTGAVAISGEQSHDNLQALRGPRRPQTAGDSGGSGCPTTSGTCAR